MSRPLADIRLENLGTRDGPPPHLRDLSLHVRYGELFTVLGPPHSGKTALLRAVAGFLPLASGRVIVDGHDVTAVPPGQRSMGIVFQEGALWPHRTVREHIAYGLELQALRGDGLTERLSQVLRRLRLVEVATRRPESLSLEHRRRLALARALATEPRVLLLDEPAAGLSPEETRRMVALVRALKGRYTIVLIEHKMDIIMSVSDRISVMHFGSLIAEGAPEQIQRNPDVRRAYLGGMAA
jgi:ABC-type branched-subunit amino acid transport system ATPase component